MTRHNASHAMLNAAQNNSVRAKLTAALTTTVTTALTATLIATLAAGLPLTVAAQADAGPAPEAIDAVFADYDSTQVPGCSLGIYRDGAMHYARGYGMANLEYDIALGPDSVFRLASVAKQFMAAAIALLDEAGELDLDDDVRKYFPDLPDYGKTVTLRQLIHHTSGIRDYLELAWLADWGDWYLPSEALRLIERQQALNFEPESEYLYSNSGYLMLADVVEQVTGQTLRDWSEDNLFAPLGMKNTHVHDDHRRVVPRRATGYEPTDMGFEISMTQLDMVGDGGIITNVQDLLRWHENFADNQLGKGRQQLIELMETPAELTNGESTDYGFGLAVSEFEGTREVSHGGSWVGYRTALYRYPEADLGVAVLCNRSDANPEARARQVAALFLAGSSGEGATSDADNSDNGATDAPTTEPVPGIELTEAQLQQHVGAYWNEADLQRRFIVLEDGQLYYDRDGWSRSPLIPHNENVFRMGGGAMGVKVVFDETGLQVKTDDGDVWPLSRYEATTPQAGALDAFTGTFYSEELGHEQAFRIAEGALTADRRTGPVTLEPVPGDRFIGDGLVYAFERDAEGAVSGFQVNSGRVRNISYVRRGTNDLEAGP
ncbi:MAG: serine hydrolase domain-containing protein [Pseudomonadota bacterium]